MFISLDIMEFPACLLIFTKQTSFALYILLNSLKKTALVETFFCLFVCFPFLSAVAEMGKAAMS